MKNPFRALAVAPTLILLGILFYELRPFLPYPRDYLVRLQYLDGWTSRGYYGFNCAAFLSNAHGELYFTEREMWSGAHGRLALVTEFADRYHLDESQIRPGRHRRLSRSNNQESEVSNGP